METKPTDTCTPDQRAAIAQAAQLAAGHLVWDPAERADMVTKLRHRAGFLVWLTECLSEPRWSRMDAVGQETIRREVDDVMRKIAN